MNFLRFLFLLSCLESSLEQAIGTNVIDTTSDAVRAKHIVSDKSFTIAPTMPGTKAIGPNTATEVSVDAVTAIATSFVP